MATKIKATVKKLGLRHPGDKFALESMMYGGAAESLGAKVEDLGKGRYEVTAIIGNETLLSPFNNEMDFYTKLTTGHEDSGIFKQLYEIARDNPYFSEGSFAIEKSKMSNLEVPAPLHDREYKNLGYIPIMVEEGFERRDFIY